MMRFTCERAHLVAAVKRAAAAVQSRNVIPIIGCLKMAATDTGLLITGTNLDEWVTASCVAAVGTPGACAVNSVLLSSWLDATPKGALVSAEMDDKKLLLTAGRSRAQFSLMAAEDFPEPPPRDDGTEIEGVIPALITCAPFASTEDARYYLMGVAINRGHAVATDGHRLCAVNIGSPDAVEAIIPNAALRVIAKSSPAARFWIGDFAWRCEDEGVVSGGKLIEGTFPDWQRILPSSTHTGSVDADDLARAFTAVAMAAEIQGKPVRLSAEGQELILLSLNSAMTATTSTQWEGAPFDLTINAKYAASLLAPLSGRVADLAVESNIVVITSASAPGLRLVGMGMRA